MLNIVFNQFYSYVVQPKFQKVAENDGILLEVA